MDNFYQIAANLILNELEPRLKKHRIEWKDSPVTPRQIWVAALGKFLGVWTTHDIRILMDREFNG